MSSIALFKACSSHVGQERRLLATASWLHRSHLVAALCNCWPPGLHQRPRSLGSEACGRRGNAAEASSESAACEDCAFKAVKTAPWLKLSRRTLLLPGAELWFDSLKRVVALVDVRAQEVESSELREQRQGIGAWLALFLAHPSVYAVAQLVAYSSMLCSNHYDSSDSGASSTAWHLEFAYAGP